MGERIIRMDGSMEYTEIGGRIFEIIVRLAIYNHLHYIDCWNNSRL